MLIKRIKSYLWESVLARPLTTMYIIASVVLVALVSEKIEVAHALIVLTVMFFFLLVLGLHRENKIEAKIVKVELDNIHTLVNSQHDELVDRVEQLIAALQTADVDVPIAPEQKRQEK